MVLAFRRCCLAILICSDICLGLLLKFKLIRNFLFHFIFLSALIILPNLGLWQLDRLEWKNELLNNISSRQAADNITTLSSTEMNQFYKLNGSFYILKIIDQNYFEQTLIEFNPTQIPNNHLQYAGTWFMLFIVVGILYFYQVYQIIRIKWNT